MSTVYIAGKLASDEPIISNFASELEAKGHVVLAQWWAYSTLPTPYLEFIESSSVTARKLLDAAYSSDVTILFPSEDILGAAVEFGAAIASCKSNPNKLIVVVDPFHTRQSVFYAHESVTRVKNLDEVRKMDWF